MTQAESLASKMLDVSGVRAVWDIHLAAAAAHRLGKPALADALVEIAEAAERVWIGRLDEREAVKSVRLSRSSS
jgi:hypothetical protein